MVSGQLLTMSLHFYFIIIITVSLCMICVSQEHVVYMLHMYHSTHHMSKDNFQRPFFPSSLGSRDQTQTTGSVPLSTFTVLFDNTNELFFDQEVITEF